ncbi:MAG: rhodanese-like domain-containing protein [Clostridiaceae bacterium]|nr:rhodanese-like domain-containing protein [Clostridiaceae bacterium]
MKNKILVGLILILIIFNVCIIKKSMKKDIKLLYNENELSELLQGIYPANILVDLREREDYEEGHIDGFLNIPSNDGIELLEYLKNNELERKSIYVMCYSGRRAAAAFELLQKNGYPYITYITFGYEDYVNSQDGFIPKTGQCDCLAD